MAANTIQLTPLKFETRTVLPTAEAAPQLNRAQQTLRIWAMRGGPITPLRINGRLAWRVSDLLKLLEAA
jgi:hypothetical protein